MSLLPARPGMALCGTSRTCTVKGSCYRSPSVRAIAVGEEQAWVTALVAEAGACEEFKPATGEALYITADQVDAHRAAGWTVTPFTHHHGAQGYHLATRET